jgi:hypothetical protein
VRCFPFVGQEGAKRVSGPFGLPRKLRRLVTAQGGVKSLEVQVLPDRRRGQEFARAN